MKSDLREREREIEDRQREKTDRENRQSRGHSRRLHLQVAAVIVKSLQTHHCQIAAESSLSGYCSHHRQITAESSSSSCCRVAPVIVI